MPENKIHIDYQCHQPFWNFKKEGKNNYCKQCKHTIHDFTQSTPEEIILHLQQNNGKACGSFYKDQINIDGQTKHSPAACKIALASVISFFAATELSAQSGVADSVKMEQHDVSSSQDKNAVYDTDEKGNSITTCPIGDAPVSEPVVYRRRHHHLRLGNYYINLRFPFVHRMSFGFYRAAPKAHLFHKDKVREVF
jgi:hypothetical protein